MATFKVSGNMKVSTLKARFYDEVGVQISVHERDGKSADDEASVAQLRDRTPRSTEVAIVGQSKVSTIEAFFWDNYGMKIKLLNPDGTCASGVATLGSIRRLYQRDTSPMKESDTSRDAFGAIISKSEKIKNLDKFWAYVDDEDLLAACCDEDRIRVRDMMLAGGLRFVDDFDSLYSYVYNIEEFNQHPTLQSKARETAQAFDIEELSAFDRALLAQVAAEFLADNDLARKSIDSALYDATESHEFGALLKVAAQFLRDAPRVESILAAADKIEGDLEFTLDMCVAVSESLREVRRTRDWYGRACNLMTDWRSQYCVVGHALHELNDFEAAAAAYELKPWLKSTGFQFTHRFSHYDRAVETMVVLTPDGICESGSQGCNISKRCTLGAYLQSHESDEVTVFLKPGKYPGPIYTYSSSTVIAGMGRRSEVVIEHDDGHTVYADRGSLLLEGLTIRRVGEESDSFAALAIADSATVVVADCVVSYNGGVAIAALGDDDSELQVRGSIFGGSATALLAAGGNCLVEDSCFDAIAADVVTKYLEKGLEIRRCCFVRIANYDYLNQKGIHDGSIFRDLIFVTDDENTGNFLHEALDAHRVRLEDEGVDDVGELTCVTTSDVVECLLGDGGAEAAAVIQGMALAGATCLPHLPQVHASSVYLPARHLIGALGHKLPGVRFRAAKNAKLGGLPWRSIVDVSDIDVRLGISMNDSIEPTAIAALPVVELPALRFYAYSKALRDKRGETTYDNDRTDPIVGVVHDRGMTDSFALLVDERGPFAGRDCYKEAPLATGGGYLPQSGDRMDCFVHKIEDIRACWGSFREHVLGMNLDVRVVFRRYGDCIFDEVYYETGANCGEIFGLIKNGVSLDFSVATLIRDTDGA